MAQILLQVSGDLIRMSIEDYSPALWTKDQLVHLFRTWHTGKKYKDGITTVGLCGYPNVGKSSTINAIVQSKKASYVQLDINTLGKAVSPIYLRHRTSKYKSFCLPIRVSGA